MPRKQNDAANSLVENTQAIFREAERLCGHSLENYTFEGDTLMEDNCRHWQFSERGTGALLDIWFPVDGCPVPYIVLPFLPCRREGP